MIRPRLPVDLADPHALPGTFAASPAVGSSRTIRRPRRFAVATVVALAVATVATLSTAGVPTASSALPAETPSGPAGHAAPAARAAPAAEARPSTSAEPASLDFYNRTLVRFRVPLLGDSPTERAALASIALREAADPRRPGIVTRVRVDDLVRFDLDGAPLFFLAPGDLDGPVSPERLDAAALKVERRLVEAVQATRHDRDPRRLAIGGGIAVAATVIAWLLLRGLFALRTRGLRRLDEAMARWASRPASGALSAGAGPHTRSALHALATVAAWGTALVVVDVWASVVLSQFAFTRPWGVRAAGWLLERLQQFLVAAADAVPGLLTAGLIFLLARWTTLALARLLHGVETGAVQVGWLDRDTARPTRRLGGAVVWLFALAMAYPYLPGSDSQAFQGVSVLAGLMLSLGASGIVGQAMAGLGLTYSRTMRVGEHVRIGGVEGTVTAMGLFAVKLHTGMGEEVSLPNAHVASQAIHNNSRLVPDGRFVLHTAVTIGYATPWRQVHAMLLEAARRTPGVTGDPPPYVVQTALSDFYVEYRLCAQADRGAPRLRAEATSALHAHIQDVFNENGVQIMSPHYLADPPAPQVVPPGAWFVPAGRPVTPHASPVAAVVPTQDRRDAA